MTSSPSFPPGPHFAPRKRTFPQLGCRPLSSFSSRNSPSPAVAAFPPVMGFSSNACRTRSTASAGGAHAAPAEASTTTASPTRLRHDTLDEFTGASLLVSGLVDAAGAASLRHLASLQGNGPT